MVLRLSDNWLWDFWLADTGDEYHVFFLQAPRSLGDPDRRHWNATIGHAVSQDLVHWQTLPDALGPGSAGAWDDLATWTGSVVEHGGQWWMFYTGTSTNEAGRVQRIGLATSSDLMTWTKHAGNPVIEADGRWYERTDGVSAEAWRDPWVSTDPSGHGFHALITASGADGPPGRQGVIGHAWSPDLVRWDVRPSRTEAGRFESLEVPQVVELDGRQILVFSAVEESEPAADQAGLRGKAIYTCQGASVLGPFDVAGATPVDLPGHYAGRVVVGRDGRPCLLAFVDQDAAGAFVGELSDPQYIPIAGLVGPETRTGPAAA